MRRTVSEPIASAKAHRIVNVSSAETPARRVRIGSRSNAAVNRFKTEALPERLMTKRGDAGRRRAYRQYVRGGTWLGDLRSASAASGDAQARRTYPAPRIVCSRRGSPLAPRLRPRVETNTSIVFVGAERLTTLP